MALLYTMPDTEVVTNSIFPFRSREKYAQIFGPPFVRCAQKGARSILALLGYASLGSTSSQRRVMMVAIWPRVASPAGERVVSLVPFTSPISTAQAMASVA